MFLDFPRSLLALIFLSLLLAGGCKRGIELDTPEKTAETWGRLICDRRGDLMNLNVQNYQKMMENAQLRTKVVGGKAAERDDLAYAEELLQFVSANRQAINECKVETSNIKKTEGEKVSAEIVVHYQQITRAKENPLSLSLTAFSPKLIIEMTLIDDSWRVTSEPGNTPNDVGLNLVGQGK